MEWYNNVRPHGPLDLKTPVQAYYEKMAEVDALELSLIDGGVLTCEMIIGEKNTSFATEGKKEYLPSLIH
jgi:hypothetical protein